MRGRARTQQASGLRASLAQGWHASIGETVEARRDLYIGFLSSLMRFDTVSGDDRVPRKEDPRFQAAWRFLRLIAERLGLEMRTYEDEAGVIEWKGTDPDAPTIGIATHLDVVPPVGAWTHPPFGGTVDEGAIWGRGAQDDKGPLATVLSAFDALRELDFQPRNTIRLLIGTYEETEDWPDMDRLLQQEELPDMVLVPDGAFPIGIGEKGIVTVQWAADWPRQDATGPLRFLGLDGGVRANVVPGESRLHFDAHQTEEEAAEDALEEAGLRLCRLAPDTDLEVVRARSDDSTRVTFVVSFTGKAAHAAFPQNGHNAALDALAFLTLVPDLPGPVDRFARFLFDRTHKLDASGVGLAEDHPKMGHSTLNLGRVEMDRAGAHAHINVRFPVGMSPHDVEDGFRAAAAAHASDLRIHTEMIGRPQPPFLVEDREHDVFLETLATAYETVTGQEAKRLCIAGTTYAKLFPLAVGFGPVDLARGEPVRVHQTDERVEVDRHLENIRIYALALALLASPESA